MQMKEDWETVMEKLNLTHDDVRTLHPLMALLTPSTQEKSMTLVQELFSMIETQSIALTKMVRDMDELTERQASQEQALLSLQTMLSDVKLGQDSLNEIFNQSLD